MMTPLPKKGVRRHGGGTQRRSREKEDAPQVRLLHRRVGLGHSRTAPPRRLVCGSLQRSGGYEGKHRGGRQGGLFQVDRGERRLLEPSRKQRPSEKGREVKYGVIRSGQPPPSRPDSDWPGAPAK